LIRNQTHPASASDVRVSVGSSYRLGTGGVFMNVFRLIRHPEYFIDETYIHADVAVVRLIFPLIFSRIVRPIPLGKFRVEEDDKVMVTGWGYVGQDGNEGQVTNRMQRLLMRAITNDRCLYIYRDTLPQLVTPEMVCLETDYPNRGICGESLSMFRALVVTSS
jgi:hypothetical protein